MFISDVTYDEVKGMSKNVSIKCAMNDEKASYK